MKVKVNQLVKHQYKLYEKFLPEPIPQFNFLVFYGLESKTFDKRTSGQISKVIPVFL